MRYYFAGSKPSRSILEEVGANKILVSYLDFKGDEVETLKPTEQVFLDSGAFGAWSKGRVIDIQVYIEYLKKHKDRFAVYANLDVIGDPEKTLENQKIMEAAGLHPLPTVHYGADDKYLHFYGANYPYIALGGLVPLTKERAKLRNWLNHCFKILTPYIRDKGLKIHGFGMGSSDVLSQYPFYSADSTSWLAGAKYGTCYKWDSQAYKLRDIGFFKDKKTYMRGANLKLLEHYRERLKSDAKEFLKMEKDLTDLWTKRGIVWKD